MCEVLDRTSKRRVRRSCHSHFARQGTTLLVSLTAYLTALRRSRVRHWVSNGPSDKMAHSTRMRTHARNSNSIILAAPGGPRGTRTHNLLIKSHSHVAPETYCSRSPPFAAVRLNLDSRLRGVADASPSRPLFAVIRLIGCQMGVKRADQMFEASRVGASRAMSGGATRPATPTSDSARPSANAQRHFSERPCGPARRAHIKSGARNVPLRNPNGALSSL